VGAVRVRQHVNPLSTRNLEVVPPPDWAALFPQPSAPLVLDLGCGSGRFLLALAQRDSARERNYLGLEIRAPLAERADGWARQLQLPHARFLATNANVNAPAWLASYPGPLVLVSFLHPDPHWKRKHWKRRIVQPPLARAVAAALAPGGQLFLQSDVKAVTVDMLSVFQAAASDLLELAPTHFGPGASPDWPPPEAERINQGDDMQRDAARRAAAQRKRKAGALEAAAAEPAAEPPPAAAADGGGSEEEEEEGEEEGPSGWAAQPGNGWLRENPIGVPTERELGTVKAGGHCWRCLLVRKEAVPAAELEL